jgi:two-component system, response regulator
VKGTRHILVVEDADEDFATVLDAARRLGLPNEIRRASSGDEGVRLLRQSLHTPASLPALVLLDLNTPKGDGRDALLAIHKDDKLRALPLVVLSTSSNPRDLAFCYACGANAYHVKPVQHGAHLLVLEQLFDYWLRQVVLPIDQSALR